MKNQVNAVGLFRKIGLGLVLMLLSTSAWADSWADHDRALALMEDSKHKEAAVILEDICWKESHGKKNQGICYGNLAECYLHMKKFDQAIRYADRSISLGQISSRKRKAAALLSQRKYAVAIREFINAPDWSKSREFYSISTETENCILRDDKKGCLKSCEQESPRNSIARHEACRRGQAHFEKKCREGDKESCQLRCQLTINSKGFGFYFGGGFAKFAACTTLNEIQQKERKERRDGCFSNSIIDCRASCEGDLNNSSCQQLNALITKRALVRIAECRGNNDLSACRLACTDDKIQSTCEHLSKAITAQLLAFEKKCDGGDGAACLENAKLRAEEGKGTGFESALKGCIQKHDDSCLFAKAKAKDKSETRRYLDVRCKNDVTEDCRAWAKMGIAGEGGPPIVDAAAAKLETLCINGDGDSCAMHFVELKDKKPQMVRSLLDDKCEQKDGEACLKMGNAFLDGSWLEKDEDGVMDIYHRLCDDDWAESKCHTFERGMRRADIRVPGDPIKWPFQLRFHLLAAAGVDSNPFSTNQKAMVRDNVSEVLGFALLPEAVAVLAGDFKLGYRLGPLSLRLGGKIETSHMATTDKGNTSTSGQFTLMSMDAKSNIGVSMSLGPIRLSVDDEVRFAQLPGRFMSIAPELSVPLLTSVRGVSTATLQNEAKVRAEMELADLLKLKAAYSFRLLRLFDAETIDNTGAFSKMLDVNRYAEPGDIAVIYDGAPGLFDLDYHKASLALDLNLEELMEMESFFFNANLDAGAALYEARTIVPVNLTVGMSVAEDGFRGYANLGYAALVEGSTRTDTFIGDVGAEMISDDISFKVAYERRLLPHPFYYQIVTDLIVIRAHTEEEGIGIDIDASAGTVLLGAPSSPDWFALLDLDEPSFWVGGSTLFTYPVGPVELLAKIDFAWWASPAFDGNTNSGRLRLLAGVRW